MLFGMTGIQPVNTWVEVEVFFESITDADRQWCEPGIRCGERRRARARNEAVVESIEDGHNGSKARTPVGRVDANGPGRGAIPVRAAGARTVNALFTPAHSSPPSVAMRPRVAAHSPMSGTSLPATETAECTDERARPLAASFAAGCSRAGSRTNRAFSHRRAHRHLPLCRADGCGRET